ncbi:hypothetical protein LZ32DRAFT_451012 [Colletotrichum eremochloae]|nr:hypothetical protein LZ32DRAFT_451012 [Colletotrichum eremochloae]
MGREKDWAGFWKPVMLGCHDGKRSAVASSILIECPMAQRIQKMQNPMFSVWFPCSSFVPSVFIFFSSPDLYLSRSIISILVSTFCLPAGRDMTSLGNIQAHRAVCRLGAVRASRASQPPSPPHLSWHRGKRTSPHLGPW